MSSNNIINEYALRNYKKMFREPKGNLKYKFIVPGSVYDEQLWDWDSWLTNIALRQFVPDDISEYEKGCVQNFLEQIDEDGRIPILIRPDAIEPDLQGNITNVHKPCLAQHIAFIIKQNKQFEWVRPYYEKLCCFVEYYMKNCRHENGIYYWLDDVAIGVDNDPCTFYRPKKSSGSIFLNCMMYKELEALCYIGQKLKQDVSTYQVEKLHLKTAVQKHCYDEKDGFYYSVDLNLLPIKYSDKIHSGAPRHWDSLIQRIGVWSGFLAMWSGIATTEQAKRMVRENLLDVRSFWAPYGVRTLSKYEKMYAVVPTAGPSCWLGPIWGISNYLVFRGLVEYGFDEEARALAEKTVQLLENDIVTSGEMHEYYDPETGVPIMNPGFQNWNLLAVNMKAWLEGKTSVKEF